MKEFTRIRYNRDECLRHLDEFRALLDSRAELEEQADVKPFFDERPQFSALVGTTYAPEACSCDLVAAQYQLFGDFGCDLAVGDSRRHVFGFVEWEDATARSLFRSRGRKATPEWSARVEAGFSQIIDWLWKLDDMSRTDEFHARFGHRHAEYFALLVVGRDDQLEHQREQTRWHWRSRRVVVNGRPVRLVTYDDLYRDVQLVVERLPHDENGD